MLIIRLKKLRIYVRRINICFVYANICLTYEYMYEKLIYGYRL